MSSFTIEILQRQDDVTSSMLIQSLRENATFVQLSRQEGIDITKRDALDEEKLAAGIKIAVDKGVLKADPPIEEVTRVSVLGKTADDVCEEIFSRLPTNGGVLLILQGLSGTGKGTTVKKLQHRLPNCMTWSNGNVFRSLTYLALKERAALPTPEEQSAPLASLLTPDFLQSCVSKLSFNRFDDGFDVVMAPDNIRVTSISNTKLKDPAVSQNVPIVAEVSQGEVIAFASDALATLQQAGCNVILEGRAQTLNYIRTPFRYELVIDGEELLGQRRAAQRVMAEALHLINDGKATEVEDALHKAMTALS
eukprot:PhM_4_TR2212/c0_g1_i1/m.94553